MGMNQGELKRNIKEDPNLTEQEKGAKLSELRAPYKKMSDEELRDCEKKSVNLINC